MLASLGKITLGAATMAALVCISILQGDIAFVRSATYKILVQQGEFETNLLCQYTKLSTMKESLLIIQGKSLDSNEWSARLIPTAVENTAGEGTVFPKYHAAWNASDPQFIVSNGCWKGASNLLHPSSK